MLLEGDEHSYFRAPPPHGVSLGSEMGFLEDSLAAVFPRTSLMVLEGPLTFPAADLLLLATLPPPGTVGSMLGQAWPSRLHPWPVSLPPPPPAFFHQLQSSCKLSR